MDARWTGTGGRSGTTRGASGPGRAVSGTTQGLPAAPQGRSDPPLRDYPGSNRLPQGLPGAPQGRSDPPLRDYPGTNRLPQGLPGTIGPAAQGLPRDYYARSRDYSGPPCGDSSGTIEGDRGGGSSGGDAMQVRQVTGPQRLVSPRARGTRRRASPDPRWPPPAARAGSFRARRSRPSRRPVPRGRERAGVGPG